MHTFHFYMSNIGSNGFTGNLNSHRIANSRHRGRINIKFKFNIAVNLDGYIHGDVVFLANSVISVL